MDFKESSCVDPEVKLELERIEGRLNDTINTLIKEGFKDVKNTISELFNKDIGHIREWMETFKGYHKSHYEEIGKIKTDMLKLESDIKQYFDEQKTKASDVAWNKAGVIIAFAAVGGGFIGWLVSMLIKNT